MVYRHYSAASGVTQSTRGPSVIQPAWTVRSEQTLATSRMTPSLYYRHEQNLQVRRCVQTASPSHPPPSQEASARITSMKKISAWDPSSSVWIRNQQDVTFVLSFISPLQVAQHVSGNHVPIFRSWRLRSVIDTCWYCAVTMSAIIQICLSVWVAVFYVCVGTWLPETCCSTCKGEIKDNTKVTSVWFLIHTELRCTDNHTSDPSSCSSSCEILHLYGTQRFFTVITKTQHFPYRTTD